MFKTLFFTFTMISLMLNFTSISAKEQFKGKLGHYPDGWRNLYGANPKTIKSGLTDDFSYNGVNKVMRLGSTPAKPGSMERLPKPFPKNGEIEFKVWLRSEGATAQVRLFLLGDSYHWQISKDVVLTPTWREYSICSRIPLKRKTTDGFWLRIDVHKGTALIAKTACNFIVPSSRIAEKGNLLVNPDFLLGSYGWLLGTNYAGFKNDELLERRSKWQEPAFTENGSLCLTPWTTIHSFNFPIKSKSTYTLSMWMKRAKAGVPVTCRAFVLTHDWKIGPRQTFEVTDEWQRYDVSGFIPASIFNEAYVRLDVQKGGPLLLQKAQVVAGDIPVAFSVPKRRAGLIGNTLISASDGQAKLSLISSCPVEMTIKNAWGKTVRKEHFSTNSKPLTLKVNKTGITGCFHVEFHAKGKLIGAARYAVMTNLLKAKLPDNPLAGHCHPLSESPADLALYDKFLPFDKTFNRFFVGTKVEALSNKNFQKMFRASPYRNIAVLPGFGGTRAAADSLSGRIQQAEIINEKLADEFRQLLRNVIPQLKGTVYGVELFNEPMLWYIKHGARKGEKAMPPEKVAALYKIAGPVIKKLAPNLRIVGPCIGVRDVDYAETFLKAGGGRVLDIFSFHGYAGNPDLAQTYEHIMKFHDLIKKYVGRDMPVWNDEQYFGVRLPQLYNGEKHRGYFYDTELEHAATMTINLIHHAAAGSKFAMFLPRYFWNGFGKERYVLDSAPACNAAIKFLGDAGTGSPVYLGEALKCFIFPEKKMVTIHAISNETNGEMTRPAGVHVFDMMGNSIPDDGKRLTITKAPIYILFPGNTDEKSMRKTISNTDFINIGEPFSVKLKLASRNALAIVVANNTNRDKHALVTLAGYPDGWEFDNTRKKLDIKPQIPETAIFKIKHSKLKTLGQFRFKIELTSDGNKNSFKLLLNRPLFANTFNGFNKWQNSDWIQLGANYLSKNFSGIEKWKSLEDLSAQMACGWNSDGLALSLIVKDDKLVFPDNPGQAWKADSLQIYFDQKLDATSEATARKKNMDDDIDYVVSFVKGNKSAAYLRKGTSGRYIGENNQVTGVDNAVKTSITKLSNGLRYDLFFPKECLPLVKFAKGSAVGFSLLINDNDGKGRKTGITLAPAGNEPFRHPEDYCTLILQK